MAGLPEIKMVGTVVADPDLKFTTAGVAVLNFTVACNDRKLDKNTNEWVDGTATFLRCNLWRQAAENAAETLRKGQRVLVTGQLEQQEYEKDGQKRTAFQVRVDEVGPSLKWATATVTKAAKSGGANSRPQADEPPPLDDEPPF